MRGDLAQWATTAPPQISISHAYIATQSVLINPKGSTAGYSSRYLWTGGYKAISSTGTACCGGMYYGSGIDRNFGSSEHWFAIRISCARGACTGVPGQVVDIKGIELTATDTSPPMITPAESPQNLANEAGKWIRGSWNAGFTADSDAGVCRTELFVDGVGLARGPTYAPHTGSWTQCGSGAGSLGGAGSNAVAYSLNTAAYANGPMTAKYWAADAAQPANVTGPVYRVNVDNSPVSLDLSGPAQALTTDGPQQIRAAASAGPSGISGIWCSVDAGPWVRHPAAAAAIEVSNPGLNTVSCIARNNAVDATGATARSPLQTWTLDIRRPSVSLLSVQRVVDAVHCVHRTIKVRVPGHWTTAWYHGHRVRVRVPGQTRRVRVERCHPHIRTVVVHRNGETIRERVLVLPHHVSSTHERVRFGARATVAGWLGEANGIGLANQPVAVLVAPADGSGQFRRLCIVRTRANGTWTLRLPPGPSRLIEAVYAGTSELAPSTSPPVSLAVRASLRLHVRPTRTYWGRTIQISGRLRGGYIPASGELVVLRIGWRGGSAEIGHVYSGHSGRFSARYTFLRGSGSEIYRIWAQSAKETDYPFTPALSRRVRIHVSS